LSTEIKSLKDKMEVLEKESTGLKLENSGYRKKIASPDRDSENKKYLMVGI
jgi:regulator of replication initiation timing